MSIKLEVGQVWKYHRSSQKSETRTITKVEGDDYYLCLECGDVQKSPAFLISNAKLILNADGTRVCERHDAAFCEGPVLRRILKGFDGHLCEGHMLMGNEPVIVLHAKGAVRLRDRPDRLPGNQLMRDEGIESDCL